MLIGFFSITIFSAFLTPATTAQVWTYNGANTQPIPHFSVYPSEWYVYNDTQFPQRYVRSIYSSGDETLDQLLKGGFQQDLIYLVYGNQKIITNILLKLSVASFKKYGFEKKVVFIDGNNRFNPYYVSKLAALQGLSPSEVLKHILISRAFTFEQMVEILEKRLNDLGDLEEIKIVMVSGITTLWPDFEKKNI